MAGRCNGAETGQEIVMLPGFLLGVAVTLLLLNYSADINSKGCQ